MIKFHFTFNKENAARWLDSMSRRGYALKGAFGPFFSFAPCDAGEYVYQVDYAPPLSSGGGDYAETMEDLGVDVVCRFGPWAYLRKSADGEPFELYTDRESRIAHLQKVARFFKILAVLEYVCALLLLLTADQIGEAWPWIFIAVALVAAVAMSFRSVELSQEIDRLNSLGAAPPLGINSRSRILIAVGSLLILSKYLLEDLIPHASDFFLGAGIALMGVGLLFLGASRRSSD